MPDKIPELVALEEQVERNKTVDGSAGALIEGFAAYIEANKNDPAAIQAYADSLKASSDELAAKVLANTVPGGPAPASGARR